VQNPTSVSRLGAERVVWTGFEPFGRHDYNPSWDVARVARKAMAPHVDVDAERLPVDFSSVRRWAAEQLSPDPPLVAFHLGLAESRSTIDIEVVARNKAGTRLDESGQLACGGKQRLIEAESSEYATPFPAEPLVDELSRQFAEHGLPEPTISRSAGSYVCNALYFHSLRQLVDGASGCPESASVFIHIPKMERPEAMRLGAVLGSVTNTLVNEYSGEYGGEYSGEYGGEYSGE